MVRLKYCSVVVYNTRKNTTAHPITSTGSTIKRRGRQWYAFWRRLCWNGKVGGVISRWPPLRPWGSAWSHAPWPPAPRSLRSASWWPTPWLRDPGQDQKKMLVNPKSQWKRQWDHGPHGISELHAFLPVRTASPLQEKVASILNRLTNKSEKQTKKNVLCVLRILNYRRNRLVSTCRLN